MTSISDVNHIPKVEELATDGSKKVTDLGSSDYFIKQMKSKYFDENSGEWKTLSKKAREFYESQNESITAYEEADMLMENKEPAMSKAASDRQRKLENAAVYLTFGANVCLLVILLISVILSGSIAIVASVIDSSLDIFSGLIIVFTNIARKRFNRYKYPQGRERLEPVGVLVFSAVMGTASLILVIEAVQKLTEGEVKPPEVGWLSLGLVAADVAVKIALFIFCYSQRRSLTARALAQDHRNDIVVNSTALVCSYLASLYWAPLDPIGAICISCWTIFNWSSSCLEQVKVLTGRAASPEFLKRLTWICMKHQPDKVVAVDTVRAFHFGTRYLVEVDIVLPPNMTVMEAHDVGEELQKKIEKLEEVERVFVHIDYETSHDPKSEHKQWGYDD